MRDPARIEYLAELFKRLWLANPDVRFGQLFDWIRSQAETDEPGPDDFMREDDSWQRTMEYLLEYWSGITHGRP